MARPEGVPADAVYDENDKTWAVGAQQGGRRVGAWRCYDVDGRQSAEATFDDAGAPMSWKTFSSQGAVIDEGAYDSGGFVARATWWRRAQHAAPTWMPSLRSLFLARTPIFAATQHTLECGSERLR